MYVREIRNQIEEMYLARQSWQLAGQTGQIAEIALYNANEDYRIEKVRYNLYTDEFEKVINNLKSVFVSGVGKEQDLIRVDEGKYSFIVSYFNKESMVISAYIKEWLDEHIAIAQKGIRFIFSDYSPKYTVEDGSQIMVTDRFDKPLREYTVRYIDEYHFQLENSSHSEIFHICQFAEILESRNEKIRVLNGAIMPKHCYMYDEESNEIKVILKGKSELYKSHYDVGILAEAKSYEIEDYIKQLNRKDNVSPAEYSAMVEGYKFGWDFDTAKIEIYNENGKLLTGGYAWGGSEDAEGGEMEMELVRHIYKKEDEMEMELVRNIYEEDEMEMELVRHNLKEDEMEMELVRHIYEEDEMEMELVRNIYEEDEMEM